MRTKAVDSTVEDGRETNRIQVGRGQQDVNPDFDRPRRWNYSSWQAEKSRLAVEAVEELRREVEKEAQEQRRRQEEADAQAHAREKKEREEEEERHREAKTVEEDEEEASAGDIGGQEDPAIAERQRQQEQKEKEEQEKRKQQQLEDQQKSELQQLAAENVERQRVALVQLQVRREGSPALFTIIVSRPHLARRRSISRTN